MIITAGKQVSIEYKVCFPDGSPVDEAIGKDESLTFIHGEEEILPAIEQALEGHTVGDDIHIELEPTYAFGPIDDSYFQEVDLELVPKELRYKNAELSLEDEDGLFYKATLAKLNKDKAILNFNHPLAGKTLIFDIKIIEIKEHPNLS